LDSRIKASLSWFISFGIDPKYLGEWGKQNRLVWKLKDLKKSMKQWHKECKQKIVSHIRYLEDEINSRLQNCLEGSCIQLQDPLLKELEQERNKILKETEELWRQRSRAIWIQSGDNNTKFFHNYANFRRNRKHIWEILAGSGHIITGKENIKAEAVNHFKDLYKAHDSPSSLEQVRVAALFSNMFTEAEVEFLYSSIELDELK
jgi:hypothetical protein